MLPWCAIRIQQIMLAHVHCAAVRMVRTFRSHVMCGQQVMCGHLWISIPNHASIEGWLVQVFGTAARLIRPRVTYCPSRFTGVTYIALTLCYKVSRFLLSMSILSLSVCPSVRLCVTSVHCDKTVESSVQIYTLYERSFSLVFWEEEWLVGATLSTWNFGSTGPRCSEIANFQSIIARFSAVTPSEKVQLTLIGSLLRAFEWA